jgi:predicted permease
MAGHDFRAILRTLVRAPGYALTAVLSVALGVGANTAIFSLIDQVLLRRLPVEHPGELVFLYHPGPLEGSVSTEESGGPSFSYPVFRALQREPGALTAVAGARSTSATVGQAGHALAGTVHRVSGNYFGLLGVRPALGRLLGEEDDRHPGEHAVAVLSHRAWITRWGADPAVLGRTVTVNAVPMTIVGVAARGFDGERPDASPDVFVPIGMNREITPDWNGFEDRKDHWVTLLARLAPGMDRDAAEAAINGPYRAQLEEDIARFGRRDEEFLRRYRAKRIVLKAGEHGRGGLREEARPALLVLMGMTLLVLLMACANLTSLQLARGAARAREVAVRLAIGASRGRLIRQLLMESLLLAAAGAVLAIAAAYWILRALLAYLPPTGASHLSAHLDGRVLAFCAVLAALSGLLAGLYPALQASRPDLVSSLKGQSGDARARRSSGRVRRSLVVTQVAVSLALLVGAGLFARTFVNLTRIDLGIVADDLVTFSLEPKLNRYDDARSAALYDELASRLAALPGVESVSAARIPALGHSTSSGNITVEGFTPADEEASDSRYNVVGPGYFRTMGTPLVAGREFVRGDDAAAAKVAVVNEAFVRHFFAGRDALGRRFAWGVGRRVTPDIEIVGIVRDAKYSSLRETPPRVFYTPYRQAQRQTGLHFYVRTAVAPRSMVAPIRQRVAALDPALPVEPEPLRRRIEEGVGAERLLSVLTASFACLATGLAALGLYGVLGYDVARRTREIGVRMALGARHRQVRALVLKDVAVLVGVGVAAGVAAAAAAGRLLQALLFGTTAWDPFVYASAAAVVVLTGLASAYLPARRASRVDPMVALRQE